MKTSSTPVITIDILTIGSLLKPSANCLHRPSKYSTAGFKKWNPPSFFCSPISGSRWKYSHGRCSQLACWSTFFNTFQ